MKLINTGTEKMVFRMSRGERRLLFGLLKLYPRVPPAHQRITRSASLPGVDAVQALLDEALAEQREENKRQVLGLIKSPKRFVESQAGLELNLTRGEVEWLLQVLNDIRVGSWLLLGSPEEKLGELNPQTAPHLWAMELAGHFQAGLLEAFEGESS